MLRSDGQRLAGAVTTAANAAAAGLVPRGAETPQLIGKTAFDLRAHRREHAASYQRKPNMSGNSTTTSDAHIAYTGR